MVLALRTKSERVNNRASGRAATFPFRVSTRVAAVQRRPLKGRPLYDDDGRLECEPEEEGRQAGTKNFCAAAQHCSAIVAFAALQLA